MVSKNFTKLVTSLAKLGLSDGYDRIRTYIPRPLFHEVVSLVLDFGFELLVDGFDTDRDKYIVVIQPKSL